MTPPDLPAPGWYDDPEFPGQFRYWDGEQWTDHRAPKTSPQAAASTPTRAPVPPDASSTIAVAWEITRAQIWRVAALMSIGALIALAAVTMAVVGYVLSLEEGFDAFDDANSPATWDFNPASVPLFVGAFLAYVVAVLILAPALLAVLEGARNERVVKVGPAIGFAGRRMLVTVRKGLLAFVVYLVVLGVGALIVAFGTATPFPVALSILLVIAYGIFFAPLVTVLVAAPTIGDPGKNSVRDGLRLFVSNWATAAGAFYLLGIVFFGISIAAAIISLIPLVGILVQLALLVVQYGVYAANSLLIWLRLDGDIDPALTRLVEEAPPQ